MIVYNTLKYYQLIGYSCAYKRLVIFLKCLQKNHKRSFCAKNEFSKEISKILKMSSKFFKESRQKIYL